MGWCTILLLPSSLVLEDFEFASNHPPSAPNLKIGGTHFIPSCTQETYVKCEEKLNSLDVSWKLAAKHTTTWGPGRNETKRRGRGTFHWNPCWANVMVVRMTLMSRLGDFPGKMSRTKTSWLQEKVWKLETFTSIIKVVLLLTFSHPQSDLGTEK